MNFNLAQNRGKDICNYNVLDSNVTVTIMGWQEEAEGGWLALACAGWRSHVVL